MSALTQVFVRVHFRYDRDRYAEDLEQFAAWLLAAPGTASSILSRMKT